MKVLLGSSKNRIIKELYYYKGDEKIIIINKGDMPDFTYGDISNIEGDIDLCKITKKDLKDWKININDLVNNNNK